VRAGELVVRWDPVAVGRAGLSPLGPVIAPQADADAVRLLAGIGQVVNRGIPVLDRT